jgi:prevent-host-death family protein
MRTQPLTSLKRRAARIIAELGPTAEPVLITQHGKPAAYLMGVEALDALNRRVAILEGIARGERAIEDGRVVTHAEARTRMQRWLESGAIHAMSGERQFQRGIRREWDA